MTYVTGQPLLFVGTGQVRHTLALAQSGGLILTRPDLL